MIPCQTPSTVKKNLVIPWGESAEVIRGLPKKTLLIPTTPKATMVIKGPSPIPYENDKVMRWSYDSALYINGVKQESGSSASQGPAILYIAGTRGITRSGRIYGAESPKKTDVVPIKDKGKTVVDTNQETKFPNKDFTDQEAEEFLKIIKKSDYRVVDQLHQTPEKISILSLLINSEAH